MSVWKGSFQTCDYSPKKSRSLGNTHPSRYTLQRSFPTLIALNDFSPDFGKFSFCFDHHRVPNLCLQDSSVRLIELVRGKRPSKTIGMNRRGRASFAPVKNYEQRACPSIPSALERVCCHVKKEMGPIGYGSCARTKNWEALRSQLCLNPDKLTVTCHGKLL